MRISPQPDTAPILLAELATRHSDQLALIDGESQVSFLALARRTADFAHMLSGRGVGAGDRVALLLPDGHLFIALLFAVARVGAIAVPLNWRWAVPEIGFAIEDCAPAALLVAEDFAALAQDAVPDFPCTIVVGSLAAADPVAVVADPEPGRPADPWLMLYTSGTTGRPKGCLLSHAGIIASAYSCARWLDLAPPDRRFSPLPLFHVGGLTLLLAYLVSGCATVIMSRGTDAETAAALIVDERCTGATIPAAMLDRVLDLLSLRAGETQLRHLTGGGGMYPAAFVEELVKRSGADLALGYGQTEVSGFAGLIDAAQQLAHPAAATAILPGLDHRIVDESGVVAVNQVGELQLRGVQVMLGYWQAAEATAAAFQDGWLKTGDLFSRDASGLLTFAGRTKELIKSGGENVYPAEVENILKRHPAVADCAVIGVADNRWGEAVKAFVVLAPGMRASGAELSAWCRGSIASYKRPRHVEFLSAIPRTELGKVRRDLLGRKPVHQDHEVA